MKPLDPCPSPLQPAAYRFGGYMLDPARGVLQDPRGVEVGLRPKTAEVLRHLADKAGRVVSREALMQAVWPEVIVTDDSLTQCVFEIRRALGDEGARLLRTLPKRGYLLAAEVMRAEALASPATPSSRDAAATSPPPAPDQEEAQAPALEVVTQPAAERRQLALLFCDLAGSTALSARLDPEDLQSVIQDYHRVATAAVEAQGGYVAKFFGDGVLAYFGWPQAREDDAERAVRAGLAVTEAVSRLEAPGAEPLAARVGIATGPVVVGEVLGKGEARERGVVGETPNLAARLQDAVGPGTVVADATTRRLTGALFEWADLGEVALKGFPRPMRAWRALRQSGVESRFVALRGAAAHLPLIGREEELALLRRRWQRASAGEGQLALVSGEAGIGKSRLLAALEEALREEDHTALRLSCAPDRQASALGPVIALLQRSAGFARNDTAEVQRNKLRRVLPTEASESDDVELIADLLSLPPDPCRPGRDLSPQRRKEETFETLHRLLTGAARQRPLLLVLEDAHWADPSTRDLIDMVIERLPHLHCLLVVTHRPEFVPPWAGGSGVTSLLLARLSQAQSAELVQLIPGGKTLSPKLVTRIVARTDGVPLFVEELTRAVVEGGRDEAAPSIPASLQASLTARLDRHPLARQAAQLGAVIGHSFQHELMVGLSEVVPAALQEGLQQLVAAGLVVRRGTPPDAAYRFSHVLLQDAAYESLLRSRRRTLHGRLLRLLEERHPELTEREPETLARHARLAEEAMTAARYLLRAGQRAMRAYALEEAEAHLTAGLELLTGEPADEARGLLQLDLDIALGQTLMGLRGFADPAAAAAFTCARALAAVVGDPVRGFAVLHGHYLFDMTGGRTRQALATAERMLAIGQRIGSREYLMIGNFFAGWAEFYMGRFAPALCRFRETVAASSEAQGALGLAFVTDIRAMAGVYEGWALLILGDVARSMRAEQSAWAAAEASRGSFANAGAFCMSCVCPILRGDGAEAVRKSDIAMQRCREQGYAVWTAATAVMQVLSAFEAGRPEEGAALFPPAMAAFRATGSVMMVAAGFGCYAEGLTRLGRIAEALAAAEEGLAVARAADDLWYEAELHRIRAGALLAAGDEAAAIAALGEAVAVARAQDAALWELRAALRLAPLLTGQEGVKEARSLLHEVLCRMPAGSGAEEIGQAERLLSDLQKADGV
jgi:class 3 adenylate cyclase/tetratricopeptide (TPR) repeat protein